MENKEAEKSFRTYRHIRSGDDFDPVYLGAITVACEVYPERKVMNVGLAFCSPSEKNFNKRIGRLIAKGRLEKCPLHIPFNGSLVGSILEFLNKNEGKVEEPQWLRAFLADQLAMYKIDKEIREAVHGNPGQEESS